MLKWSISDDDVFCMVMDFSKHRLPNGEYEIIIYEVQNPSKSLIIAPQLYENELDRKEYYDQAFGALCGDKTFYGALEGVQFGNAAKTSADIVFNRYDTRWLALGNKLIQRLFFNCIPILQETIPNIVILSEDDLDDDECMQRLYDAFKSKSFVIKELLEAEGLGNKFINECKSPSEFKEHLQERMHSQIKKGKTLMLGRFLLIEEAIATQSNPKKAHEDVYRSLSVQKGKAFSNAEVIMRWQSAKDQSDSHRANQCDYYALNEAYSRIEHGGEQIYVRREDKDQEAERNRMLAEKKPKLFKRLTEITEAVSTFNRHSLEPYDSNDTRLRYGNLQFASRHTKLVCLDKANALMANVKEPTGVLGGNSPVPFDAAPGESRKNKRKR